MEQLNWVTHRELGCNTANAGSLKEPQLYAWAGAGKGRDCVVVQLVKNFTF